MKIRRASAGEMLALWGETPGEMSPTTFFFHDNLQKKNAEFWALDRDGELIGELYVFKKLEDHVFADGRTRAYLCAFRVRADLRGQGYGTLLMLHVLDYLKAEGFQTVTIGVEEEATANLRLYRKLGFCEKIADCAFDPCARDENQRPKACSNFWLLLRP